MHTDYIPPIRPSGTNSLEARIKALEVAQGYDVREQQTMRDRQDATDRRISEALSRVEDVQHKAALWVIAALLTACASLALIVVKLKAPWLVTP